MYCIVESKTQGYKYFGKMNDDWHRTSTNIDIILVIKCGKYAPERGDSIIYTDLSNYIITEVDPDDYPEYFI